MLLFYIATIFVTSHGRDIDLSQGQKLLSLIGTANREVIPTRNIYWKQQLGNNCKLYCRWFDIEKS